MSFHPAHVALIDDTGEISPAELARVASDLTLQVSRDFGPVWNARANVTALSEHALPAHFWPVRIRKALSQPGALGYHTDQNNQPVAYIELTSDWTVTASHELMEMLADPQGSRLHDPAPLPQGVSPNQVGLSGSAPTVRYLVEVADPPEATSYVVGQTRCSDFIDPDWYQAILPAPGVSSHTGALTLPREIGDGGYCSFTRPDGTWFQVMNESGRLVVNYLGRFDKARFGSLREWVDSRAREYRAQK